jgi:hypothetical protein
MCGVSITLVSPRVNRECSAMRSAANASFPTFLPVDDTLHGRHVPPDGAAAWLRSLPGRPTRRRLRRSGPDDARPRRLFANWRVPLALGIFGTTAHANPVCQPDVVTTASPLISRPVRTSVPFDTRAALRAPTSRAALDRLRTETYRNTWLRDLQSAVRTPRP